MQDAQNASTSTSADDTVALKNEIAHLEQTLGESKKTQESTSAQVGVATSPTHRPYVGWDNSTMLKLSFGILIFGFLALGLITYLIDRVTKKTPRPRFVLQAFALPLIIISAIFLVVTGYSQEQIAPVIGLLGTIAGYLLGRGDRPEPDGGSHPTGAPSSPPAGPAGHTPGVPQASILPAAGNPGAGPIAAATPPSA